MRVVLFGDSHLAALKLGLAKAPPPPGLEVSFWGTPGNRFRHISWQDECIIPDDDKTAAAFARFSAEGLTRLDPADFDAVVFVGARIRTAVVVPDLLAAIMHPTRHLSRDYMRLVVAEHLFSHTTYQLARKMAATGKTRVYVSLVSLSTDGIEKPKRIHKLAREAGPDVLQDLWTIFDEVMEQDGITHLAQHPDTVVGGYFTDARYGFGGTDAVHKNADYGAVVLGRIYDALAR